jgi:paraquat-inducible protein A
MTQPIAQEVSRARSGRRWFDRLIGPMIPLTAAALVGSWFLPVMTVERLPFWEERLSIARGLERLFDRGEYLLFGVILLFSVLFPIAKLIGAYLLWFHLDWSRPRVQRYAGILHALGRWSMLDVFVVAVTVAAVSVSIISDVRTHAGIYVFAAAVVASMLVVQRIERLVMGAAGDAVAVGGQ